MVAVAVDAAVISAAASAAAIDPTLTPPLPRYCIGIFSLGTGRCFFAADYRPAVRLGLYLES